jgi:L-lactate dehydrogenase complex protein LldE
MHIGGGLERIRAGVRTMHLAEILAAAEPRHHAGQRSATRPEAVA